MYKLAEDGTGQAAATILSGGAIGGTSGYLLADAFWNDPSRTQKIISGVTGLIIGSIAGAAIAGTNQDKNILGDALKISPEKIDQLAKAKPTRKMLYGITDQNGNWLTNSIAHIARGFRKASPIDQQGDISILGTTIPVGTFFASKWGADRFGREGLVNAAQYNKLRAELQALDPSLKLPKKKFFASRKAAKEALEQLSNKLNSPTLSNKNSIQTRIQRQLASLDTPQFLQRRTYAKGTGGGKRLTLLASILALFSAIGTNNLTGFNDNYNKSVAAYYDKYQKK